MRSALANGGLLLVGEPFWIDPPPDAAYSSAGIGRDDFGSLVETQVGIESAGMELVEMLLATTTAGIVTSLGSGGRWTSGCAITAIMPTRRQSGDWMKDGKRDYLEYGRRYLGWGVFVLRAK